MNEDYAKLETQIQELRTIVEDNNRLIRLIRRDAMVGLVVKVVLYLLLLGVPLFFLGSYLEPLLDAFSGAGTGSSSGMMLTPSAEQIEQLKELYGA